MIVFPSQLNTQGFADGRTLDFTPDPLLLGGRGLGPGPTLVYPCSGARRIRSPVRIHATFPSPIVPSSVTPSTFTVTTPAGPLAGAVWVDPSGLTACFIPVRRLLGNTVHTVALSSGIQFQSGLSLSAYSWRFTTAPLAGEQAAAPRR
jgi:hypothetical protein